MCVCVCVVGEIGARAQILHPRRLFLVLRALRVPEPPKPLNSMPLDPIPLNP